MEYAKYPLFLIFWAVTASLILRAVVLIFTKESSVEDAINLMRHTIFNFFIVCSSFIISYYLTEEVIKIITQNFSHSWSLFFTGLITSATITFIANEMSIYAKLKKSGRI